MIHTGRKQKILILAVLLAAQVLTLLYWQSQKRDYTVDELYTFADMHEFSLSGKKSAYFHDLPEWQPETWMTVGVFRERFTIMPGQGAGDLSVPEFASRLVTGRNYMGVLNLAESIISPGRVSNQPAFLINIVSFLGLQAAVCLLLRKMRVRFLPTVLCLLMLGGCTMMLYMGAFVRFYLWTGMLFAAAVLLHGFLWTEDRWWACLLKEAAAACLLYLGLRNSELIVLLAGALALSFTAGLLLRRRWLQAALYGIPVIGGGLGYLAAKTSFLSALLDPGSAADSGGQLGNAAGLLQEADLSTVWENLGCFFDNLGIRLFSAYDVMVVFFLAAAVLAGVSLFRKRRQADDAAEQAEARTDPSGFRHVIAAVSGIDLLFLAVLRYTDENLLRYVFFIYPLIAVWLWTVLDRHFTGEAWQKGILGVLAALAVTGSVMPFKHRDIPVVYEDQAEVQEVLDPWRGTAVILGFDEYPLSCASYECIVCMDPSAPLYIMDPEHHSVDPADCPDTLLLWMTRGHKTTKYTADLRKGGYTIEKLTSPNASTVYLCTRGA